MICETLGSVLERADGTPCRFSSLHHSAAPQHATNETQPTAQPDKFDSKPNDSFESVLLSESLPQCE